MVGMVDRFVGFMRGVGRMRGGEEEESGVAFRRE